MITKVDILHDLILSIPLFLWVLFVVHFLSRWVCNWSIKRGYPKNSGIYFGRKIIHIFASGIAAILLPFFFKEPFLPFFYALILAIYTWWPHRKNRLHQWFQVKENIYEVNFSIMWGVVILIGWFLDKSFWLGVIPALFMSIGDGVTGIVRNIKYKKRTKAWEGSLAMFITCTVIGGLKFGLPGILAATLATFAERTEIIDDNISVPLVSFSTLYFLK